MELAFMSQSPSLRGSGRFWTGRNLRDLGGVSQSPSLRGSGRFTDRVVVWAATHRVSIPFIAGQWSLPTDEDLLVGVDIGSQSPSLRGSGRFAGVGGPGRPHGQGLNPLHCGAVVASGVQGLCRQEQEEGLNPLHCGAVVASRGRGGRRPDAPDVSIPFIAGQWSLLPRTTPFPFCRVLLRKRRLPCDHIICTRLLF